MEREAGRSEFLMIGHIQDDPYGSANHSGALPCPIC